MCGIFGQISKYRIDKKNFDNLVKHSKQRGVDSSGLVYLKDKKYRIVRADFNIEKLLNKTRPYNCEIVLGHSRLITNGLGDNQPVVRDNICVIHNGIIVNEREVWDKLTVERKHKIDSEAIVAIAEEYLKNNGEISEIPNQVLALCRGVIACALVLPEYGKLLLFSNNGSLYVGYCTLQELEKPIQALASLEEDKVYVIKKLGLSVEEFDDIMGLSRRTFQDYRNQYDFVQKLKTWVNHFRLKGWYPK